MPVTPPADVAPNELITSAWGDSVRQAVIDLDDDKLNNFENDTMVGTLTIAPTATNLALILKGGSEAPSLQFQSIAGTTLLDIDVTASDVTIDTLNVNPINVLAAMVINIASASKALALKAVTETPQLSLESVAGTQLCTLTGGASTSTLSGQGGDLNVTANGQVLVGKSATALGTVGVEIVTASSTGSIRSTISAASIQNLYCRHEGSADANAESFVDFRRATGTLIGSVTQVSTTGVAYNTTSDERLKTNVGLVERDGLATIDAVTVRRYTREDGAEHVGMFAQELNDVIPQAVTVGGEDPHAAPWQTSYCSEDIIGHLLLAVQQLSTRVAELEGASP